MTSRRMVAVLGVPLLLAAAWALGGALFNHPPTDLGSVIVVVDGPSTPSGAPLIGPSPDAGGTGTADPSSPPGTSIATPSSDGRPAPSPAPTGAAKVTTHPAPTAGHDDDDDDDIDDDDADDDDGADDATDN